MAAGPAAHELKRIRASVAIIEHVSSRNLLQAGTYRTLRGRESEGSAARIGMLVQQKLISWPLVETRKLPDRSVDSARGKAHSETIVYSAHIQCFVPGQQIQSVQTRACSRPYPPDLTPQRREGKSGPSCCPGRCLANRRIGRSIVLSGPIGRITQNIPNCQL